MVEWSQVHDAGQETEEHCVDLRGLVAEDEGLLSQGQRHRLQVILNNFHHLIFLQSTNALSLGLIPDHLEQGS